MRFLKDKISINKIYILVVGYLYSPILIFVLGWTKIFVSVPVVIVSSIAIVFAMRKICNENRNEVYISFGEILLAFCIFFLFFIMVGHSNLTAQDFDWHKHHAIFNDLMNYDWPVVYEDGSMLTYYLGQYMVPSFIGKVFNSSIVMTWSIPLWNALGLTLVYSVLVYLLKAQSNKKKICIVLFMLLWGGCTSLGNVIYHFTKSGSIQLIPKSFKWIDMFNVNIHFSSNYDALYGAFQHVIAPWLATCFFIGNQKHIESYVMMALPLLFTATFAFVYFVPILLFFAFWKFSKNHIKDFFNSVFGIGNVFMLPLAGVLGIYLTGNVLSDKPDGVGFSFFNISEHLLFYIVFVFSEFLFYAVFLLKRNIKNPLFYVAIIELLIIPFFMLGLFNDLCSRGSIPARFILMFLFLDYYFSKPKKDWRVVGLSLALAVSVIVTSGEIVSNLSKTFQHWNDKSFLCDDYKSLEGFYGNEEIRSDEAYNYFTPDFRQSLFYNIAKTKSGYR
jgi:hypothetical protein